MSKLLKLRSVDSVMYELYHRIESNKSYDINLNIISKNKIESLLNFLEDKNEFEKCNVILNFLKSRFNHDENYSKQNM